MLLCFGMCWLVRFFSYFLVLSMVVKEDCRMMLKIWWIFFVLVWLVWLWQGIELLVLCRYFICQFLWIVWWMVELLQCWVMQLIMVRVLMLCLCSQLVSLVLMKELVSCFFILCWQGCEVIILCSLVCWLLCVNNGEFVGVRCCIMMIGMFVVWVVFMVVLMCFSDDWMVGNLICRLLLMYLFCMLMISKVCLG